MILKNKVIVVTGGAGLLGKEFIKAIAHEGGIGIIADINEKDGNKLANELKVDLKLENVEYRILDTISKESINSLINYLVKKYGKIDALVNNAYPRNKNYGRHFFDVEYPDFCENINLHLGGYFLVSQQIAKYFVKQNYGNIINIASVYGLIAPRFDIYSDANMTMPVEYAVIKSGIIHLTKYIAKYLKGLNIRVNSISPGGILNNQPQNFVNKYKEYCLNKGMLDKADICGTLTFLLSDMSEYINGQNIIVDDGWSL